MENVFVSRPEMGDMLPGIPVPFQRCEKLRSVRVVVTKEDQGGGSLYWGGDERRGLLDEIFFNVPIRTLDEFANFERFEVAVRGRKRLEGLRRWQEENAEMLLEEWQDPERWERWFRLELLEGAIEKRELGEDDSETWSGEESEEEEEEAEEESEEDLSEEEDVTEESEEYGTGSEEGSEEDDEPAPRMQMDSSWL